MARRALRAGIGFGLLLAVGCESGPGRPIGDRQDPARFEKCDNLAGQAAYEQAVVHMQRGRDVDALPLFRSVIEQCPEHILAHRYYQDLAQQLGGEALDTMQAFYRQLDDSHESPVPGYVKLRLVRSQFKRKQGLDRLVARHGDFAYAHLSLGRLSRSVGKLADAAQSLQRAIDRHPKLLEAHLELAETLEDQGRYAEAELPYQNYLTGSPGDLQAIRAYVQLLLYKLHEPRKALPWIERLLQADDNNEDARMDRAAAQWMSGQLDEALAGYLAVLQARPDNALAALNVGHLHYDAMVSSDADKQVHWPKARAAYRMFENLIRPESGFDHFEERLAVPYRLKAIGEFLGPLPDDAKPPRLEDLR